MAKPKIKKSPEFQLALSRLIEIARESIETGITTPKEVAALEEFVRPHPLLVKPRELVAVGDLDLTEVEDLFNLSSSDNALDWSHKRYDIVTDSAFGMSSPKLYL